jgi:hypothetical protein
MYRISILLTFMLAGCQPASLVQPLDLQTAPGSGEPHLTRSADGEIVLSYLEPDEVSTALRFTVLNGDRWLASRTVARGNNWMVNWADFPSVVPLQNGLWAAHWLVKAEGGPYAYDTLVAQSMDAGQTWSAPVRPHTDGTLTEHGFVSVFPAGEKVGVVWLDGRKYADVSVDDDSGVATQLRTTTLGFDQQRSAEGVIDEAVCDCCQTDIAMAASGPVVVYRNRTSEEIRDIHVARLLDGQWQPGQIIAEDGWKISGCPVNGPAISAAGQNIAVAWFTASPEDRVQVAFSSNSAEEFGPAIDVTSNIASDIATDVATDGGASNPLGRVDVALLANGDAMVSWLESATSGRLLARRVSAAGTLGPTIDIASMAIERNSGFPQMVADGNRLIFAWTKVTEGTSLVETAYYQL